jgi:hypothetical protein
VVLRKSKLENGKSKIGARRAFLTEIGRRGC